MLQTFFKNQAFPSVVAALQLNSNPRKFGTKNWENRRQNFNDRLTEEIPFSPLPACGV
jgi:hypothetical protein